ncbi:MAG TPA: hypothetical protein VHD62_04215 [Opitutaceae bacterium]|nr:hypothetical protein [Opitutaceae bacterium]
MNRTLSILLLGAACAIVTHLAWFRLHSPCGGDRLDCQLSWMKTELALTDAQFARIKAIHAASSPRLLALAAQVAQMRDEYAAFERERTTVGQIDFLEFARFVEHRRSIDQECLASTRQLVAATCDVMDPAQRSRYLNLLTPAIARPGGSLPQ